MPDVRSIISGKKPEGYFILDSMQESKSKGKGVYDKEENFKFYLYKPKHFGKLVEGALFLYRLPGGGAVDRKFSIYGGGRIEKISAPDASGSVRATISEGFRFAKPLKQGDPVLEAVQWTSRTRKPKANGSGELSWEHTFSQYGMNQITEEEFWAIVDGQSCIAAEAFTAAVEEDVVLEERPAKEFVLEIEQTNSGSKKRKGRSKKKVGTHRDYDKLQAMKSKIGELGELIVLNVVYDELEKAGIKKEPIHVSKDEGDGLGYDIRSWAIDGTEIDIEVKTTTSHSQDGFDITSGEVAASHKEGIIYKIYRVYDLDPKKGTGKLCVYEGPVSSDAFELVPTSYKAYIK